MPTEYESIFFDFFDWILREKTNQMEPSTFQALLKEYTTDRALHRRIQLGSAHMMRRMVRFSKFDVLEKAQIFFLTGRDVPDEMEKQIRRAGTLELDHRRLRYFNSADGTLVIGAPSQNRQLAPQNENIVPADEPSAEDWELLQAHCGGVKQEAPEYHRAQNTVEPTVVARAPEPQLVRANGQAQNASLQNAPSLRRVADGEPEHQPEQKQMKMTKGKRLFSRIPTIFEMLRQMEVFVFSLEPIFLEMNAIVQAMHRYDDQLTIVNPKNFASHLPTVRFLAVENAKKPKTDDVEVMSLRKFLEFLHRCLIMVRSPEVANLRKQIEDDLKQLEVQDQKVETSVVQNGLAILLAVIA